MRILPARRRGGAVQSPPNNRFAVVSQRRARAAASSMLLIISSNVGARAPLLFFSLRPPQKVPQLRTFYAGWRVRGGRFLTKVGKTQKKKCLVICFSTVCGNRHGGTLHRRLVRLHTLDLFIVLSCGLWRSPHARIFFEFSPTFAALASKKKKPILSRFATKFPTT